MYAATCGPLLVRGEVHQGEVLQRLPEEAPRGSGSPLRRSVALSKQVTETNVGVSLKNDIYAGRSSTKSPVSTAKVSFIEKASHRNQCGCRLSNCHVWGKKIHEVPGLHCEGKSLKLNNSQKPAWISANLIAKCAGRSFMRSPVSTAKVSCIE